mmetsp:Transcript_15098/g.32719  ORF Transcript_15098/g.32719 Transcript_15098/m.32719 type:complete len:614 (+) Transcript_15098:102-1943(+)
MHTLKRIPVGMVSAAVTGSSRGFQLRQPASIFHHRYPAAASGRRRNGHDLCDRTCQPRRCMSHGSTCEATGDKQHPSDSEDHDNKLRNIAHASIGADGHPMPYDSSVEEMALDAAVDKMDKPQLEAPAQYMEEMTRIAGLAFPLMIQNVFGYLLSIVCTVSIGRVGSVELAASSLANSIYAVTGFSFILGLSTAMETLAGQAYGGRSYKSVGLVLQRAVLVCFVCSLPVAALWLNSTQLMIAVGQAPDIAAMAGRYLMLCIPCIFFGFAFECLKKYLQAQRIVRPSMYATAAATLLSPLFFHVWVHQAGLGLDGAAYAYMMCQLTSLGSLLAYTVWYTRRTAGQADSTWGGWSLQGALSGWGEYLQYGIPAMLMISLEWWIFEVAVLMAGWLPDPRVALAVGGICVAVNGWAYMIPLGLSSAINTLVSNALGAGDGAGARRITRCGLVAAAVVQTCIAGSVYVMREQVCRVFTQDLMVVAQAVDVLPVLCYIMFWDGVNAVVNGVLRGSGQQALGASVNATAFLFAIPAAYLFAFQGVNPGGVLAGMSTVGKIWSGVAVGPTVQAVILLVLMSRWNWGKEVDRVRRAISLQRVQQSDILGGSGGQGVGGAKLA